MFKKTIGKKAVVITLESIFALIVTGVILTAIFSYMGRISMDQYNKQALNRIGQDSLTILEKDGLLKEAIETGSLTNIESFLQSLPPPLCERIYLKDSSKNTINSTSKVGCITPRKSAFERRSFVANFTPYYAEVEVWHNESFPGGTVIE